MSDKKLRERAEEEYLRRYNSGVDELWPGVDMDSFVEGYVCEKSENVGVRIDKRLMIDFLDAVKLVVLLDFNEKNGLRDFHHEANIGLIHNKTRLSENAIRDEYKRLLGEVEGRVYSVKASN